MGMESFVSSPVLSFNGPRRQSNSGRITLQVASRSGRHVGGSGEHQRGSPSSISTASSRCGRARSQGMDAATIRKNLLTSMYMVDFEDWMAVRRTGKNSQGRPVPGAQVVKIPMSFDRSGSKVPFLDSSATPKSIYRETIGGWYGSADGDPFAKSRLKDPNAPRPMASTAGCPFATVKARNGLPRCDFHGGITSYREYMDVTYEENVRSIKDNIRGKSLRLSPTGVNEDTFLTVQGGVPCQTRLRYNERLKNAKYSK
ncbi:hypothetical protein Pmar_PMAR012405 [Perkinsus marinus ATCC 50983]|uniref:Uncharacterized protein n=1 Tax=Perkinsus marinus (strain ATCC 50983 / TXsc) TaxID=423536 RepID=C5K791_PERM5|nr:hypothetical protein Pmar_PMAR012405 [Perkinsus marinus ATCC 50983]EER19426.1 hypothetical protein Pmar_PMAR012405 [Perkinsus marinus ATCC 50983]|eukprot:XP_002787630.1 hypothetical protein Pmar_PMAR012405 [Perkinsus marinus ATCC 50983]